MAESEEELKNLLMRVKEESAKNGLKLNIKKTEIMATGPITSCQIEGEDMEAVTQPRGAVIKLLYCSQNCSRLGVQSQVAGSRFAQPSILPRLEK